MSSEPVIQLREITKLYRIYARPIDRLKEALWGGRKTYHRQFRALDRVHLDVAAGKTVGIVGRNGSGKSTLLRIVAGTLRPTEGSIAVRGTVAALLELGSGFNPEQTGRENVYINAAVHGLTRAEIDARYQEIVEFSELSEFMEQPVKTYSSGMIMRLAFSTAVQVQRDILIIDEALSVGDEMFQRKCIATLEAMQNAGRTILFVSHSLETVKALCDEAVLLERGRIVAQGQPIDVINEYTRVICGVGRRPGSARQAGSPQPEGLPRRRSDSPAPLPKTVLVPMDLLEEGKGEFAYGTGEVAIEDVQLLNAAGEPAVVCHSGDRATLRYKVRFLAPVERPIYGMTIKRLDGVHVYGTNTLYQETEVEPGRAGDEVEVDFRIPLRLLAGNYYVTVGCVEIRDGQKAILQRRADVLLLKVLPDGHATGIVDLQAQIDVKPLVQSQAA